MKYCVTCGQKEPDCKCKNQVLKSGDSITLSEHHVIYCAQVKQVSYEEWAEWAFADLR